MLDIENYFQWIIKQHEIYWQSTNPVNIYEIENRITSEIKSGYQLEFLIPKIKTLLGKKDKKVEKKINVVKIVDIQTTELV